ncbi:MAG: hypothetical protein Q8878_01070 [Bacillota bacterium]|nr:hypothetical protein [Bacillota bacterium]
MKAQTLLRSNNIFTAAKSEPFAGFVAVSGGKIAAVGAGDGNGYVGTDTKVYELGDRVVCPGFSDVHCFFTGYSVGFAGADLSSCKTLENIISVLKKAPRRCRQAGKYWATAGTENF